MTNDKFWTEPRKLRSNISLSWWDLVLTFSNHQYDYHKLYRPIPSFKLDLQVPGLQDHASSPSQTKNKKDTFVVVFFLI